MEGALGEAYDQLKKYKQAIAAYAAPPRWSRAIWRTVDALGPVAAQRQPVGRGAQAVSDAAQGRSGHSGALIRVAEIERRQGKFPEAWRPSAMCSRRSRRNLQAGFTEGTLLDAMAAMTRLPRPTKKWSS